MKIFFNLRIINIMYPLYFVIKLNIKLESYHHHLDFKFTLFLSFNQLDTDMTLITPLLK